MYKLCGSSVAQNPADLSPLPEHSPDPETRPEPRPYPPHDRLEPREASQNVPGLAVPEERDGSQPSPSQKECRKPKVP
jgi:hypothetical protein